MKLFCFTITFFLVNVLANIETDYKWIVVKTNTAIELAYNKNDLTVGENSQANGLEYVIEKILEHVDFREKSFADINLMFAVPDKTELNNMGNGCLRLPIVELYEWSALFDIQFNLQRVIRSRLGIAIPEPEAGQDFGSLNLTTLAEQRRHYVELALKNIFKREFGSMYDQFIYQLEIRDTINVRGLNVTTLVENRKVTGTSLENVITRVLETGAPESNEAVENQILDQFLRVAIL